MRESYKHTVITNFAVQIETTVEGKEWRGLFVDLGLFSREIKGELMARIFLVRASRKA